MTSSQKWVFELIGPEPPKHFRLSSQAWSEVVDTAVSLQLSGQLLGRVAQDWQVPDEVLSQLRRQALEQGAATWELSRALQQIARAAAQAGVLILVLKGGHALLDLYSSPVERVMADLDIMVSLEALDAFEELLQQLGYRADWLDRQWQLSQHHHVVFRRQKIVVEVHWRLAGGVQIAQESLWERAVPLAGGLQWAEGTCFGLGLEDRLLFMCLHIAQHKMMAAAYHYSDIARFLARYAQQIEISKWTRCARQWGGQHRVVLTLKVLERLFPGLSTHDLCRSLGEGSPEVGMVDSALACVLYSEARCGQIMSSSLRTPKPKLLLPDYDLRKRYGLSADATISWKYQLRALFHRILGWCRDWKRMREQAHLREQIRAHRHLLRWLQSGSLEDSKKRSF